MKKHLIAAAVAGALAVPAMAQVTVSGRIDTSIGSAKNEAGNTTTRVSSSVLTSNQVTLSGSEDLGGGLKGNFTIHTGFASDAANSTTTSAAKTVSTFAFGDRGMQVGVSGGFGAVDIGRTTGTMLNSTTASGVTGNIGNLSILNGRPNNMVSYTTPNLSGVTLRVLYSAGGEAKPNTNTQTEYSLQYSAGPLLARVAMANYKDVSITAGETSGTKNIFGTTSTSPSALTDDKVTETGAQFDYDLGMAKLNVRYQKRGHDTAANEAKDFTSYGVGAAIPFGDGLTANIDYVNNNSETNTSDFKLTSLALVKSLSKRTNVYFAYASKNGEKAAPNDNTETLAAIGVRHSF